jgi:peptide/nickel transport system substrate-binding protein
MTRKFVRNPYYFKVDTEGNQLPYLDYQQVQYVDNPETLKIMTLTGENEYIGAPIGEVLADWPIYAENADEGDYRMITASADFGHIFLVMPNLSSQDPQKGPLLANKDFRIALSHAINRDELIALFVTVGDFKGTPAQQSPIEASPFYDEELTTQYTEYDVAKANEMLDGLGLTEKDANGFRLGPDGESLNFVIMIPTYSPLWVDGGTLVAKYWREVGINVEAKAVAPQIWTETIQTNTLDFSIHSTGSGGLLVINSDGIDAYSVPYLGWTQRWGPGFAKYIATDGAEGVEPPEFIVQMNKLREEILYEADQAVAEAKTRELLDLWGESFVMMGISRPLPSWMLISNDLKNTPQDDEPWVIFMFGVGGNVNPCQFYKD